MLTGWLRRTRTSVRERVDGFGELTEEDARLQRLRVRVDVAWAHLGARWGRGFTLYMRLLPKVRRDRVFHTLRKAGVLAATSEEALFVALKELTELAKKVGEYLWAGDAWKDFVNLETLGGYRNVTGDVNELVEGLHVWLTNDKERGLFGSHEAFMSAFRLGLGEFLSAAPRLAKRVRSVEEWASDPSSWGTSGATTTGTHKVWADGGEVKVRGKWGAALALDPAWVVAAVKQRRRQRNIVIKKREAAKVRNVVNGSTELYLKMVWLNTMLSQMWSTEPSLLYRTPLERVNWFVGRLRERGVFVPLDVEAFDTQPNNDEVVAVLETLFAWMRPAVDAANLAEFDEVSALCVEDVRAGGVALWRVDGREYVIPVRRGIVSGWYFTGLLDTMINYAYQYVARQAASAKVDSYMAFGDDGAVVTRSGWSGWELWAGYSIINVTVNPRKFWVSSTRDEFLRVVASQKTGVVAGYLSRALLGILWRNPIREEPKPGEGHWGDLVSQWSLATARGADSRVAHGLCVDELARSNKVSVQDAIDWLHTPASLGGGGAAPWGQRWLRLRPARREWPAPELRASGAEALNRVWSRYGVEVNPWGELLPGSFGDAVVVPWSLVSVNRLAVAVPAVRLQLGGTHWLLRPPVWRSEVPRAGREAAVRKLMKVGVGAVAALFEEPAVVVERYARCSRVVWFDWLFGKVAPPQPSFTGWGPEALSVGMTTLFAYFLECWCGGYVKASMVTRARLGAESVGVKGLLVNGRPGF